jgi:hypothetical protein
MKKKMEVEKEDICRAGRNPGIKLFACAKRLGRKK